MPKRKKPPKKKCGREGRVKDARRWLRLGNRFRPPLVTAYTKRYAVSEAVAWEYRVEPLRGDMFVVPKRIEDHELYLYHPIL